MKKQILHGLQTRSYEHPFDRAALDALRGTPGVEKLIRKSNEWGVEHFLRIQYTGSNLRVTRDAFPDIYDLTCEAAKVLDVADLPDLYIQEGNDINALTAGVERPVLVLNAGCIDYLTADELVFVIGHELGHIKSGHVLYHQVGDALPVIGSIVAHLTLGLSDVVSTAIEAALLNWQRMSDLTADRAGLLACQSRDAAISAMVKIAGLPHKYYERFNADDFIEQAREFKELDKNPLDRIAKIFSILGEDHPWTVLRAAEFDKWTSSGEYNRLLESHGAQGASRENTSQSCPSCGVRLTGGESFCPSCGFKLAIDLPAAS